MAADAANISGLSDSLLKGINSKWKRTIMTDQVIDCGDALSIADVGDVYAKLLTPLAENKSVKIDCSQIERIDAAGIQMLYAFSKEAAAHGHPLNWEQPSEAFVRSARLLGLAELMNIDNNSD